MADYSNPNSGSPIADDGFSDAAIPESEESTEETTDESTEQEDAGGEQTSLLPKSFFGGKELVPGKRCEVEIEQVYDDQVQVRYVEHSESSEEGESSDEYSEEDDMAEMMQ